MSKRNIFKLGPIVIAVFAFTALAAIANAQNGAAALSEKELLGKRLFFLKISNPPTMSCASCHSLQTGGTGPKATVNEHGSVYRGAVHERAGNRKPPSSVYATRSPLFQFDKKDGLFEGGNFWDGRATGWKLGNPAADQAQGPFLNPVEQNMPDQKSVCESIKASDFADLFETVWGKGSLNCSKSKVSDTYDKIALSIAAFEDSASVNQFNSKFDLFLVGKAKFTNREARGFSLFHGKAKCILCHVESDEEPSSKNLFTDFTYDNLGVPRNPENPFYRMNRVLLPDGSPINPDGRAYIDPGLGGFLRSLADPGNQEWRSLPFVTNVKNFSNSKLLKLADENEGKHRVPTLRNLTKKPTDGFVKAYSHNGYFKSLWSIVHFYNTRDILPVCPDQFTTEKDALAQHCWPEPEVPQNVNRSELGNLGLSLSEERDLVEFLKTLTDL